MAEITPPAFTQTGGQNAGHLRRAVEGLAGSPGVLDLDGLAVTENDTPNMTVKVASGRAVVAGTHAAFQGSYVVDNQGEVSVEIPAAHATLPRKDLIVARVHDTAYGDTFDTFEIEVVEGTPDPTPLTPEPPPSALVLAEVDVLASATAITNARITDLRTWASGLGGIPKASVSARPGSPRDGDLIYETDTHRLMQWRAAPINGWVPPWNLPWGRVAYAQRTSGQGNIDVLFVNLTGLSVTFAAVEGRRYRISGHVRVNCTTWMNGWPKLNIQKGGVGIQTAEYGPCAGPETATLTPEVYDAPGAGFVTYNLALSSGTPGQKVTTVTAADSPAFIAVEDVGPA